MTDYGNTPLRSNHALMETVGLKEHIYGDLLSWESNSFGWGKLGKLVFGINDVSWRKIVIIESYLRPTMVCSRLGGLSEMRTRF